LDERGLDAGIAEQVKWIHEAVRLGAQGVKISKSLGMGQVDRDGHLIAIDDPRLEPIWAKAGELGLPVLIHTADPEAFFHKPDGRNERYEEILGSPEWSRYGKPPSREELFAQRERLLARHPEVNFIGAHFGMQEDDLAQAAALLDRIPNYYVDTAAVVHALGRQPFTAREFFIRYQDRILFGTDGGFGLVAEGPGWTPERLFRSYFEFLETRNEYVEYPLWGTHNQGRWRVYGLDLPDEVLAKVYAGNAERLIPSRTAVAARLASLESARLQPPGNP
jgi:predicted TIM-barrel fold metal-dependent hydrolase